MAFRELMSRFPTGVAVVASVDTANLPYGMTCSSLTSVCLDPPTILVCLRSGSRTAVAIGQRHGFAVNILHAGGREVAETFAAPVYDRFARVRWHLSDHGLPWLEEAVAVADFRVVDARSVGDHTVVFGEAVGFGLRADAPPLLYGRRRFARWPDASERPDLAHAAGSKTSPPAATTISGWSTS